MTRYDFGYPWWLTSGHLIPLVVFGVIAGVAVWRGWPRWLTVVAGLVALWAFAGFLIMRIGIRVNAPTALPTEHFLSSGTGRVLDIGAGSGRTTIMVLEAVPHAHVTALDLYQGYYGIADNTPARLLRNARVAGVDARVEVQTGDMRHMPFDDATFDAAVSSYAIDHLDAAGQTQALAETARVLKPGGEFLLMVVNSDMWLRVAFPLPGFFKMINGRAEWSDPLMRAGFDIVESGTMPGTFYVLARKAR